MGFLLRNIPVVSDGVKIDFRWSASLRNIALAVILTRAGLGLDPTVCHRVHSCIYLVSVYIKKDISPINIFRCFSQLIDKSSALHLLNLPSSSSLWQTLCICVARLWKSSNQCVYVWRVGPASSRLAPQLWSLTSSSACPGCGASSLGKYNTTYSPF